MKCDVGGIVFSSFFFTTIDKVVIRGKGLEYGEYGEYGDLNFALSAPAYVSMWIQKTLMFTDSQQHWFPLLLYMRVAFQIRG